MGRMSRYGATLAAATVITAVLVAPGAADASCVRPAPAIHWVSVLDAAQGPISPQAHIWIAHTGDELRVTLDGQRLVAAEQESGFSRFEQPPSSATTHTLEIEVSHAEEPMAMPVSRTETFTTSPAMAPPSATTPMVDGWASLGTAQTGYDLDEPCLQILQSANCFDNGDPELLELEVESDNVVAHTLEWKDSEGTWRPSHLIWPSQCGLVKTRNQLEDRCYRVVALDAAGQRHPGEELCGAPSASLEPGSSSEASCTAAGGPGEGPPGGTLWWLVVVGLLVEVGRRAR